MIRSPGPSGSTEEHDVRLRAALRSRLLPVAALVALLVALSAPTAFLMLQQQALLRQASEIARRVARLIRREVRLRPKLWRYDTIKIIQHVRELRRRRGVLGIEIVDQRGRRISALGGNRGALYKNKEVLWGRAPIALHGRRVGAVWVAVALGVVRRETLLLFGVFLAMGCFLGACILWLPMRVMSVAEGEIRSLIRRLEEARRSLADWNVALERQVGERNQALQEAFAELQAQEQRLRTLSARSMSLQAEERRHIARELHDSAGQALTAIHIHLQLLQQQLPEASPHVSLVAQALNMSEHTLEEIRRAVMMLGPSVLDDFGLSVALRRACEDFQERTQIAVSYQQPTTLEGLPKGVESACYRIIQESLTNIARHADAAEVSLTLETREGCLWVSIVDDGCGFAPEATGHEQISLESRGLRGMQERIALFGGRFVLESAPGQGTKIQFVLPYIHEDPDDRSWSGAFDAGQGTLN